MFLTFTYKGDIMIEIKGLNGEVLATFPSIKHELVLSTEGVATVRPYGERRSVYAVAAGHWSSAEDNPEQTSLN